MRTFARTGIYIRTSGVRGRVTAEGSGIGGVTVRLSGPSNAAALTAPNGEYALTNLRAGNYTVEISGFDAAGLYSFTDLRSGEYGLDISGYDAGTYAFDAPQSLAFTLARSESTVIDFAGTASRTASIVGGSPKARIPAGNRLESNRTIYDDRKLICYNAFCLVRTKHVSLATRRNEPDSVESNGDRSGRSLGCVRSTDRDIQECAATHGLVAGHGLGIRRRVHEPERGDGLHPGSPSVA